jgi:hypothetical protein
MINVRGNFMKKIAFMGIACLQVFVAGQLLAQEEQKETTEKANPWHVEMKLSAREHKDYLDGSDDVDNSVVQSTYNTIAEKSTSETLSTKISYTYDRSWTFEGVLPYGFRSMDRNSLTLGSYSVKSDGMEDVKLSVSNLVWVSGSHHVFAKAGISLPTGSISKKDDTPAGDDQSLPYNMQLGSGTYDFLPEISYIGFKDKWSFGGMVSGVLRTGKNSNSYRFGNVLESNIFGGYQLTTDYSTSLHLAYSKWGNVQGNDSNLDSANSPEENPDLQGGQFFGPIIGLHAAPTTGSFKGMSADLLFAGPSWMKLNGPQLGGSYWLELSVGWPL